MSVTPTVAEVFAEGQFVVGYFPNCAGNNTTYEANITVTLTSGEAAIRKRVGEGNWATTNAVDIQQIHDAVLYLTCAKLWQIIIGVMLAYDAEQLPPEFVHPDAAAASRDFYLSQVTAILAQYDIESPVLVSVHHHHHHRRFDDDDGRYCGHD
jgi:hypothetical protein